MRPPAGADASECLRVLRPTSQTSAGNKSSTSSHLNGHPSVDYLIPLASQQAVNISSSQAADVDQSRASRPERCGYWETSFTRDGIKAIARGETPPSQPEAAVRTTGSYGNLSQLERRSSRSSSKSSSRRSFKNGDVARTHDASSSAASSSVGAAAGLSQSQSTQPLLENGGITPPESPDQRSTSRSSSIARRSIGVEAAEALDASSLCRQTYANVRVSNAGNSAAATPSKSHPRQRPQNEISC